MMIVGLILKICLTLEKRRASWHPCLKLPLCLILKKFDYKSISCFWWLGIYVIFFFILKLKVLAI